MSKSNDKLVRVRFTTVSFEITRAGARFRKQIRVPQNSVAIVGVRVSEKVINAPMLVDARFYGKGAPGSNSAAFVLSLTREYIDEQGPTFRISTGVNEKMYYAQPVRLGIPEFEYGGTVGGFLSPVTVTLIDPDTGLPTNYYLWESATSNLGNTEVLVDQP